jgi:ribosome recycling factor
MLLRLFQRSITTTEYKEHINSSIAALKIKLKNFNNVLTKIESSKVLKPLVQISSTQKNQIKLFVIEDKQIQFVKKELTKLGIDSELKQKELHIKPSSNADYKKDLNTLAEKFKIDLRSKRMDCRNAAKKDGVLKEQEKEIQKITDDGIKCIDELVNAKIKEMKK